MIHKIRMICYTNHSFDVHLNLFKRPWQKLDFSWPAWFVTQVIRLVSTCICSNACGRNWRIEFLWCPYFYSNNLLVWFGRRWCFITIDYSAAGHGVCDSFCDISWRSVLFKALPGCLSDLLLKYGFIWVPLRPTVCLFARMHSAQIVRHENIRGGTMDAETASTQSSFWKRIILCDVYESKTYDKGTEDPEP